MDLARRSWGSWTERCVVAALAGLFVWKGLLVGWASLNTDFPNYYLGGVLFRGGWPLERLNDWVWMQRQKDHLGLDQPLVGYLPSTLWSSLIVVPLTWLPPLTAKRVWLILNLLALGAIAALLRRLTRLTYRRIALVGLLAIVPLRTNFQFGQQHVLVLLLLVLATWAYFEDRPVLSGVALALGAALKLYPALFALYFWRKRQWRALSALAVASLAIGALGIALFGFEALREYLLRILPRSLRGEYNDPYITNLNSVTALLRRLFVAEPGLNPGPLVHAPMVFVVLQPILQAAVLVTGVWALDRGAPATLEKQKLDWAAFGLLLILLSTGTSTYHLCALILPATLLFDHFQSAEQRGRAAVVLGAWALICLPYARLVPATPSGWRIFFGFPRLYPLVLLWALVVITAWRARAAVEGRRSGAAIAAATAAFAALAGLNIASGIRHFQGQLPGPAERFDLPTMPLIATTPVVAGSDIYFTRMDDAGYVVDRIDRPLTAVLPAGTDLFFPTATAASADAWCELASTTSRVVRFPRAASRLDAQELVTEVDDAQQPAISADARWLGFLRETRGRGALWILDREAAPQGGTGRARERQLLDASHDVLDFSFLSDGRIAFAAYARGTSTIALVDPAAGAQPATIPIETSDRPARYPAVSPDGRWLAYAEEQRGQWQLWKMDLETKRRWQLTHADCNSVTPAWLPDSSTLIYASDCGRAIGHTALRRLVVGPPR